MTLILEKLLNDAKKNNNKRDTLRKKLLNDAKKIKNELLNDAKKIK